LASPITLLPVSVKRKLLKEDTKSKMKSKNCPKMLLMNSMENQRLQKEK